MKDLLRYLHKEPGEFYNFNTDEGLIAVLIYPQLRRLHNRLFDSCIDYAVVKAIHDSRVKPNKVNEAVAESLQHFNKCRYVYPSITYAMILLSYYKKQINPKNPVLHPEWTTHAAKANPYILGSSHTKRLIIKKRTELLRAYAEII